MQTNVTQITGNLEALYAAFNTAQAKGIKRPKVKMDELVVKLAPATGKNPGALYVQDHGVYMGKIVKGQFFKQHECTPEIEQQVQQLMSDPLENMIAYGRRTGMCCICGRELTNHTSIDAGIGPICADKFGF